MNYIHFRLNWLVIANIFFYYINSYEKEIFKINIQNKYSDFIDKKNNI